MSSTSFNPNTKGQNFFKPIDNSTTQNYSDPNNLNNQLFVTNNKNRSFYDNASNYQDKYSPNSSHNNGTQNNPFYRNENNYSSELMKQSTGSIDEISPVLENKPIDVLVEQGNDFIPESQIYREDYDPSKGN